MTHPLNSDETAIVIDTIHQNLQPDEYIKHDDSPFVFDDILGNEIMLMYNTDGTRERSRDYFRMYQGTRDDIIFSEKRVLKNMLQHIPPDWKP